MKKTLFFIMLNAFLSSNLLAEDECIDCAKRKLGACAEECALVPSERARDCQRLCVRQYCEHRCLTEAQLSDLSVLFNLECEECKDQQFPLCGSSCNIKSEYKKALCQIDCAVKNCDAKCK